METGSRRDPDCNLIPAHYIVSVNCFKNDQEIMKAQWGTSVSKNPYFAFKARNAAAGDVIRISWVDNLGEKGTGEITLT